MKIQITFDLDDHARRWIAWNRGTEGLASHEECKVFIEGEIEATLQDLSYDYDEAHEEKQ